MRSGDAEVLDDTEASTEGQREHGASCYERSPCPNRRVRRVLRVGPESGLAPLVASPALSGVGSWRHGRFSKSVST